MFLMGVVFFLVLLLTFAIVLTVTRPTSEERTIEGRIARLRGALSSLQRAGGRQLCHHQANALERNPLAGPIAAALEAGQKIQLLLARAESLWSVSGVLAWSLGLAVAGYASATTSCRAWPWLCCRPRSLPPCLSCSCATSTCAV